MHARGMAQCEITKCVCIKGMEKYGHEVQASYEEKNGVCRQFFGAAFMELKDGIRSVR